MEIPMTRKIKIFFVGELHSSHALSWIDLLQPDAGLFEVRGFHFSPWNPPSTTWYKIIDGSVFKPTEKNRGWLSNIFNTEPQQSPQNDYIHGRGGFGLYYYNNLSVEIEEFQPDIIQTFGIFPASVFFMRALPLIHSSNLIKKPKWVVQARGGPDLALNQKNPILFQDIISTLQSCDCFIADNAMNYSIASDLGLASEKLSPTGSVPGSGGIDLEMFREVPLPSKKEPLILWPKAYNCIQSDGLVVVEALRRALPQLGNFKLVATAAIPEVEYWFKEFLGGYGDKVSICERLPRDKIMEIFSLARVLLAPSLSDGVPNSVYEAMASNTVPLVSPLETITPIFKNDVNAIYAPNLDPEAIAIALVKAMHDDNLVDQIAINNKALLPTIAGRELIRQLVVDMYQNLARFN